MDCSLPDPPSIGFSRQEYWSGLPFPYPGDVPNPGIKPGSPAFQANALTSEPPGKPNRRAQITDCSPKQPLNDLNNLAVIPQKAKTHTLVSVFLKIWEWKILWLHFDCQDEQKVHPWKVWQQGMRQRRLKESLLTPEQSWLASLAGMSRWWGQPSVTKTCSWNGWMQDSSQSRWLQVNVN